ncbi:hypothetical protein GT370_16455 [Acidocella sp. MX-AZ03]|nr:hypothetical protein [Acidocella sp. MX-AZ03]WBO58711.1 hypothetical protein GT370_16455 [Acidocella sp. MX-AZ03]
MADNDSAAGHYVELREEKLFGLIRAVLEMVEVDEAWYLATNADVAQAVSAGKLSSGKAHYVAAGYFENRLPRPVLVDEAWYLAEYPDVAEAIANGGVASATLHFHNSGFLEGRLPHKGWSVLRDGASAAVVRLPARVAERA